MADIVLLAVPGMGVTDESFAEPLFAALREGLGDDWSRLYCDTILCQSHLQTNIERVFESMQKRDMDFLRARKFMLYSMAETAAQLGAIQQRGGNYEKTQRAVYTALEKAAQGNFRLCAGGVADALRRLRQPFQLSVGCTEEHD